MGERMNHRITHAALGLIAATLIALGTFAVPVSAVALEASGETGSAADTDTSDYIVDWTECGTCVWSIDSEGTLVVKPADGAESGELPYSIPWENYKAKVCSVKFEGTVKATKLQGAFQDMARLEKVDLSGLDSSKCTAMFSMFNGCSNLRSVNLPRLDTSHVASMSTMFSGCSKLVSLDLSKLDTSGVNNMTYMFSGCSSLASLNLSGLNTSAVNYMWGMFYGCSSLVDLDLSSFDTSNVVSMYEMFRGCSSLARLDLSSFDSSAVSDMSWMFYGCSGLVRVELGASFSFKGNGDDRMASLPKKWWRSSVDGIAYAFDGIPNNVAAIYTRAEGIESASISVASQIYSGSVLEPKLRVIVNEEELADGVDYEVSYSGNFDAGTATVTVIGMGGYAGTAVRSFEILPADASGAEVEVADQVWTGEALEPEVRVALGEKALVPGTDYDVAFSDNANAGTACVKVSFKGNYTGSAEGSFEISPVSISGARVSAGDCVYTGSALEPEVSVALGGKNLERRVDYDVAFSGNVDAGTATVTVTGIGNYAGSVEGSFAIARADISDASLSTVSEATYTGSPLEPEVRVELGGRALSRGADYSVTYRDNVGVGTATATVTGVGNYAGNASVTFVIVAAPDPDPEPSPTPDPEPTPAPDPEPEPVAWTFKDVSSSVAHSGDINWLASAGVSTGWAESDGTRTFRPYWNVARADMAAFLYRLAGSPGYTAPSTSPFKDVNPSTAHYKEICWLAEKGISEGWSVSGGREFRPYASVARCDMAAFLYRLAGSPSYAVSGSPFIDCGSKTPHYKEVCWLASTGVSAGWDVSGGREFRSYTKVARADMAAFLHRMKDKGLV